MMTTLRSERRTRRNARFDLEYLDDRIVLSTASVAAEVKAHVAAMVSSTHTRAAEKAAIMHERHEARAANIEDARTVRLLTKRQLNGSITPYATATPSVMSSSGSASLAAPAAATAVFDTATSTTTTNPASLVGTTTTHPVITTTTTPTSTSTSTSTSSNSGSGTSTTLPANVSVQLQSVYSQFESSGGSGTFSPTGVNGLVISGTNVGINFQSSDSAEFNTFLSQLQSDGLQVSTDSATYGIIDGMLPIAQLPAVAQISSTASVTAMFQPMVR